MCGILFCARWDEGPDSGRRLDGLVEELRVANARRGSCCFFLGNVTRGATLARHKLTAVLPYVMHEYRSRRTKYALRAPFSKCCGAGYCNEESTEA